MKMHDASDITCHAVMDTTPAVLAPETTVAAAVQALLDNRLLTMPVVDAQGRYIGMFRKAMVVASVLPQVLVHDKDADQINRMIETGMLSDNLTDVRARFAAIGEDPVSGHVDKDSPVLRPDQSLVSALFHIYLGQNFIPVVEAGTNQLLGVISAWDVLENMSPKS